MARNYLKQRRWLSVVHQSKALATFLVILLASLSLCPKAVASNSRVYTYDLRQMIEEVKSLRAQDAGAARLDAGPTIEKYIPLGRPTEEVFLALHASGFRVHRIHKKGGLGIADDEVGHAAILRLSKGLFWSLGLMSDELVIRLISRDGVLVRLSASITLLHP